MHCSPLSYHRRHSRLTCSLLPIRIHPSAELRERLKTRQTRRRRPRSALVCIPKTLRQPGDHSCFSRLVFSPPLACVDDGNCGQSHGQAYKPQIRTRDGVPHGRTRMLDHCRDQAGRGMKDPRSPACIRYSGQCFRNARPAVRCVVATVIRPSRIPDTRSCRRRRRGICR